MSCNFVSSFFSSDCVCVFLGFAVHKTTFSRPPVSSFPQALLLLHRRTAAPEEQHLVETAKLLVFLNLSFTYLKLERPTMALRYGEQALIIDQKNAKALFRCGQVSGRAGTWDGMLEERPQGGGQLCYCRRALS